MRIGKWNVPEPLVQMVKFGIVGVSNSMVGYLLYSGSLLAMRMAGIFPGVDYLIANALGFVISVAWSFHWNSRYVFREREGQKRSVWKALLKTYASYSLTGIFLNSVLLYVFVHILGMSAYFASIPAMAAGAFLNFLLNKYWAFR